MIGEQTSLEFAAAFTLASKTIYDKFRNKFLSELPGQRQEKRMFLDIMARDTPHYFRCITSENLHPYTYLTATETFRSGLFGTFTASKSYEENTSDWQLQHWTEHGLGETKDKERDPYGIFVCPTRWVHQFYSLGCTPTVTSSIHCPSRYSLTGIIICNLRSVSLNFWPL